MLPTTFAGGNLETVGVLDAFLHARASPNREIVFLSVGDTRDHRRQYKDPALRTISIDFILNLIANLRQLGIESFGILTTHKLCGGGALAVINGTWARFLDQIGKPRPTVGNGAAAQPQHVETLIDQPLMRAIVGELSVSEPGKPARSWTAVPGDAADVYPADIANGGAAGAARACALRDPTACARVHAERAKTPFLAQLVNRRASPHLRPERIALAPDWLFGRGCLLHVRAPLTLLRHIEPMTPISQTRCEVAPTRALQAQPAPGPAAGFLVATHFVYSMALKRKRSFRAFGWDAAGQQNRTHLPPGDSCWKRSSKAILFSHTFFAQTDAYKAVLCAMPGGNGPECVCCVGLKSLDAKPSSASDTMRMETTGGATLRWSQARATKLAQGCTDYQMFWD